MKSKVEIDLEKIQGIQQFEGFCYQVIRRLDKLGVNKLIFDNPPNTAEIQLAHYLPEETYNELRQVDRSELSNEPNVNELDGVTYAAQELEGEYFAVPLNDGSDEFLEPRKLVR